MGPLTSRQCFLTTVVTILLIQLLFQLFFDNSFLPDVCCQAYISPVFKKGDATQVCIYRPISLTCTLCKLMESVIKDQLLSRLKAL